MLSPRSIASWTRCGRSPRTTLAADDDALYVDWQHQLDPGTVDVKSRLVRAFVRNATPQRPITRLLTGHKGSGKTTELNRVASALHSGHGGKKVFVSTLCGNVSTVPGWNPSNSVPTR